jgi:hypothetical protein
MRQNSIPFASVVSFMLVKKELDNGASKEGVQYPIFIPLNPLHFLF